MPLASDLIRAMLPPRYRNGVPVSAAPMGTAPLVYGSDGRVAWDAIWCDFCDLALAGGPPHRPTILQPGNPEEIRARAFGCRTFVDELEHGPRLVTAWEIDRAGPLGWFGLVCPDEAAAEWMMTAILAENITVHRDGSTIFLPTAPTTGSRPRSRTSSPPPPRPITTGPSTPPTATCSPHAKPRGLMKSLRGRATV